MSSMKRNLGKPYIVNLLRRAFITKDAASQLYDLMKDEIVKELTKGKTVNLFGLVYLVPYKHDGKTFGGCINRELHDTEWRVKPVINRTIKEHFRDRNQRANEDTKHP
jgi:hypothetical protein